jgi:hypothetical protein
VGQIAKRYNAEGPSAVYDPQRRRRVGKRLLTAAQQDELGYVVQRDLAPVSALLAEASWDCKDVTSTCEASS